MTLNEELITLEKIEKATCAYRKMIQPSLPVYGYVGNLLERVYNALAFAHHGMANGEDHKTWVIDRMVRALTACPDYYTESDEYKKWVQAYCAGEDGPDTYSWDTGTAP
jgi:hypothetical protein